ncbi:MAG: dihydrofolate reductase [Saprospiraceae bacterium]
MMIISAIAAASRQLVIGKDNQIPWHMPTDIAWFKRQTLHHYVLMGRESFRGLGHALPKRTNIVITRDPFFTADGVLVAHSIEDALGMAYDGGETEVFIIGGGQIFAESQDLWDRVYLTEIDLETEGDTFFPELKPAEWQETWREEHQPDEKNKSAFTFRILERKPDADL